jgi:hypothetical protein
VKRSSPAVVLGLALAAAGARAQPGPGPKTRTWDPNTIERVAGTVVRVERPASAQHMGQGVHLVLRTDGGETVAVRLGPAWWVDRQDVKIVADDRIAVKGSRVTVDGKPALVATEMKKGERTLVLRNEAGVPVWSGRRGGRRRGPPPARPAPS